ncbi:hypothetical protein C8R42DRAFT_663889 [Lentinula raphanica]|nr:hypothetical protein C8R42DRAFT_663889 [Lentinula raphanica]
MNEDRRVLLFILQEVNPLILSDTWQLNTPSVCAQFLFSNLNWLEFVGDGLERCTSFWLTDVFPC